MRRIIAILCVCLLLTGCGTRYEDAEDTKDTLETIGKGYFTRIKAWGDIDEKYEIVYANDTKVKYLIWHVSYKGGVIPLYNAYGSLQVYGESEEDK